MPDEPLGGAEVEDPEPIELVGPYGAADLASRVAAHRFWVQTQIGRQVAIVVSLALLVVVALVFVLALEDRSVGYIKGVAESLQPYILPAFGVLVGYALPRRSGDT